ncbi:MAG: DsbA family protein [Terriglobia bacterium]
MQCKTAPANATPARGAPTLAANTPLTAAQGAAILSELRAIRELLERGATPGRRPAMAQNVRMKLEPGWHALGRTNAPVMMVEFADLQCPFCRRFETTTFAELKKEYIKTGKLRFVARDLPLPMHAYALGAAEAARCAGDQGKFWQFRNAVLGDPLPPGNDVLLKHAQELGLSMREFQACLSESKYRRQIEADQSEAAELGIHGTPAFVIGRVSGGWLDGMAVAGARPLPFFQQEINGLLSKPRSALAKAHSAPARAPIQSSGFVGSR